MYVVVRTIAKKVYEQLRFWYYQCQGSQHLTVGTVTADFAASDRRTVEMIHWMYRLEKEEIGRVLEELCLDDVFYDIGANIGLYTAFASRKARKGRVIAFEPYPPNLKILRDTAERNGGNIDIYDIALSSTWGTSGFQQSQEEIGAQVGALTPQNGDASFEVKTAPVDGLIIEDDLPIPNVVKIDVEGAEFLVLEGMEETLKRPECRAVYCEVHSRSNNARPSIRDFGVSTRELRDFLVAKDFEVQILEQGRGEDLLIAERC